MSTVAQINQSIERYENYVRFDGDNLNLRMTLADLYHRAGRLAEAQAAYDDCGKLAPDNAVVRSKMAALLITKHRFADAEQAYRALIADGVRAPALVHNLGICLFYQQRWEEAHTQFSRAIEAGSRTQADYAYLSRCLHHLGRLDEALAAARQWEDHGGGAQARGYAALLQLDHGAADKAEQLAHEVLASEPDNVYGNLVAGLGAIEQERHDAAQRHFETVLRQQQDNARAWQGLGLTQLYAQDYVQATTSLEQAEALQPGQVGVLVTLGWVHVITQDFIAAEQAFRRAIETNRNFAEAHGGLAVALAMQEKHDQAEQEMRVAQRLPGQSYGADYAEAILMAGRGEQQAASSLLATVLARSPRPGLPPLSTYVHRHLPATAKRHSAGAEMVDA
jgi:tetratricopeptide (TPR) repeat protein